VNHPLGGTLVRFPELSGDEPIRFDALGDGSYLRFLDYADDETHDQYRYKFIWFYPFITHIHVWYLNEDGVRLTCKDFSPAEAQLFCRTRSYTPETMARVIMFSGSVLERDLDRIRRLLLTDSLNVSIGHAELAVALLKTLSAPDLAAHGLEPLINDVLASYAEAHLRHAPSYANNECFARRAQPMLAEANGPLLSENTWMALLKLSSVIAPRESKKTRINAPPSFARIPGTRGQYSFHFQPSVAKSLRIDLPKIHLGSARAIAPIRLLNELVTRFLTQHRAIETLRLRFALERSQELSGTIQFADEFEDLKSVAFGSRRDFNDVTSIPDPYFTESFGYESVRLEIIDSWIDWQDRKDCCFWRGTTTGLNGLDGDNIVQLPRYTLCELASKLKHTDCHFNSIVQSKSPEAEREIRNRCNTNNLMADSVPNIQFLQYRYLVDIDGNVNSWGFFTKLLMGACVLKVESLLGWRQWYYADLQPWTHYVPVRADLSDFAEQLDWCRSHPEECRQISRNARDFAMQRTYETEMTDAAVRVVSSCLGVPVP